MLRSQCRNESKPYLELITVYRSFLQSGFLNGSQKEELRNECKGFIDEAMALFPKETILLYYRGNRPCMSKIMRTRQVIFNRS